jgi:hypothetical protein
MIKAKPKELKMIIKLLKLNPTKFAEKAGLTPMSIYNALAGKPIGSEVVSKTLLFTGLKFEDLFFVTEDITPKSNMEPVNVLSGTESSNPQF